jgi:signal transduction histidine kinase
MRILKTIFLCYFFTGAFAAAAQDSLLGCYPIISDTAFNQYIGPGYWEKLEDIDGKFTIEEVRSPALSAKFHKPGTNSLFKDTVAKTHWMRFGMKNMSEGSIKVSIGSGSELSDFYLVKANDNIAHFATGWKYPWGKKEGLKKINAAPLVLPPGEEIMVYIRKQNKALFHIPSAYQIPLYSTEKFIEKEFNEYQENSLNISYVYMSFFSGLFFLAAIFNFLIYRAVKNKVNLYFSLFLVGMISWYSPVFRILLPRESAAFNEYFNFFGVFWIVFLLFFIRHYFQIFKKYPQWDKLLVIFSMVIIIFSVGQIFFPVTPAFVNNISSFVNGAYLLAFFVTIFLNATQKGRHKIIFYKAVLPLIVFLLISFVAPFLFPDQVFTTKWLNAVDYIGGICIAWAVIIFSKYLFEDYGKQQQQILQVQIEKEREQAEFIAGQKVELEKQVIKRTEELKKSIENLRDTQSQLIQSEKMASLGELTAGIAHEIQNPLNFVNNFSDVNTELVDELKTELATGNTQSAIEIADNIKENEQKINHHGKRADAIVKGMLQHSRTSSGQKEPTDINALTDEYLRLAYHGLRAKDKSFNAPMKTDFDNSIGKINIIPQDIGRVILNLINNAFYAVDEKKKQIGDGYEPTVSVSTKKTNGKVKIKVSDNGNGIPQKVLDKIFQPFFTTKPTGQGTGLGLSLSYDIIKAHSGEITVETMEGEGSEFKIDLPVQ